MKSHTTNKIISAIKKINRFSDSLEFAFPDPNYLRDNTNSCVHITAVMTEAVQYIFLPPNVGRVWQKVRIMGGENQRVHCGRIVKQTSTGYRRLLWQCYYYRSPLFVQCERYWLGHLSPDSRYIARIFWVALYPQNHRVTTPKWIVAYPYQLHILQFDLGQKTEKR